MIVTIIAFIIVFMSALLVGMALTRALYHKTECKSLMTVDIYMVCGMMALTVYAQFMSLFMKISFKAFLIVVLISIISAIYIVKSLTIERLMANICSLVKSISFVHVVVILFLLGICVLWTCDIPRHYDTYLYHAQAIRWIEEFGIVKGIGNLHNRLAYNSAFMCLQALFSFSFIFNPSLHVVNGFISLFFIMYAALSNNIINRRKIALSDFFKAVTVIYICTNAQYMSSCQTDDMALLLFTYVVTKWAEMIENKEENIHSYAFLCIIGVFAATVKISTVSLVLLAVYPIYLFILNKKYNNICKYVLGAILVAIPWFIRSVLISGYILYPYASIDLFNVPWKMKKEALIYDSMEISAWAKGIYSASKANLSPLKWIPLWFSEKELSKKLLIIIGIMSAFFILGFLFGKLKAYKLSKNKEIFKEDGAKNTLYLYSVIALAFWFFTAPLYRYGCVFLMIPTVILLSEMSEYLIKYRRISIIIYAFVTLYVFLPICSFGAKAEDKEHMYIKKAADYEMLDANETTWEGMTIYYPKDSDQIGYSYFPAAISIDTLNGVELIGNDLKSGIKHK